MNIINNSLHIIDVDSSSLTHIDVDRDNNDLRGYLTDLIGKVTNSESRRKFEFTSNTTEVKTAIDKMISGEIFKDQAEINANRLLRVQEAAQVDTEQLMYEIQKGALIQAHVKINDKDHIIFAKADHIVYLDEKELKNRNGFPVKRKIYKAFMARYTTGNLIDTVYVYDSNSGLAKYWWSGFLELSEITTDEQNTSKAFDNINKYVLSKIKEDYRADHNILRNRVLGYFRSNQVFEIDDFIQNAIGTYVPVNSSLNIDNLKSKIKELPDKKGFDSHFNILVDVIKAKKLKNVIPINDKIDLHINDFVDDLDQIIEPYKYRGEKFIKIKTDSGYEAFKK